MDAHPLTTVIAARARQMAPCPDMVAVAEHSRGDHHLYVNIFPGSAANAGAIIGGGGYNISELRRYADALALDLGLTVKIRVITEDRQPTESRP